MKYLFLLLVLFLISGCAKTEVQKSCDTAADCIPVGCGCECSGCGGFPYEDIINIQYEDQWYEEHQCNKIKPCLTVCCPARIAVCKENVCSVEEVSVE